MLTLFYLCFKANENFLIVLFHKAIRKRKNKTRKIKERTCCCMKGRFWKKKTEEDIIPF